jgi:Protein phosphatase 2C
MWGFLRKHRVKESEPTDELISPVGFEVVEEHLDVTESDLSVIEQQLLSSLGPVAQGEAPRLEQVWPGIKNGLSPILDSNPESIFGDSNFYEFEAVSGVTEFGQLAGVSLRGVSHKISGEPKQDAIGAKSFKIGDIEFVAFAVADGVGSKRLSQFGSRSAVRHALEWCCRYWAGPSQDWNVEAVSLVNFVASELVLEATRENEPPTDYSTTMQVNIVSRQEIFHVSVGDGFSAIISEGLETVLSRNSEGDEEGFFSTKTWTIPSQPEMLIASRQSLTGQTLVVAGSDGAQEIVPASTPGLIVELLQNRKMIPIELLWHVSLNQEMCGDDRSLIVWWHNSVQS